MRGFNDYSFKRILEELNKIKIFVAVPRIALVTEADLALNGDPVDFVNGEPVKQSVFTRVTVRLPLTKIIDIYHNDYSISIVNRSDLTRIIKTLSDILDRLENSIGNRDEEIFDYVSDFYESILKQNREKVTKRLEEDKPKVLGFGDMVSTNYADKNAGKYIDLSDVIVN